MKNHEYQVEVLLKSENSIEEVWNPVGYQMIFDNVNCAKNFLKERQIEYPNNRYRITRREVGEWEVI